MWGGERFRFVTEWRELAKQVLSLSALVEPALRQLREERGTHVCGDIGEVKS
jgi:hypothetical protein